MLLVRALPLAVALLGATFAHAQGPLAPTGAPAPQGKTLTQLEPRTDVATLAGDANAVIVISQRGSYYLSGNVTITGTRVGIAIAASDVTLDLNGFTIVGSANAPAGIDFRGSLSGCRIYNGHIVSLPAGIGVRSSGSGNRIVQAAFEDLAIRGCTKGFDLDAAHDVRVERARVSTMTAGGIDLNSRGTVVNCVVDAVNGANAVTGIDADVVTECQVTNLSGSTLIGIDAAQVTNCRLRSVGGSGSANVTGIQASLVRGCVLESVSGNSIIGIFGSQVVDSRISSLSQVGGSSISLARAIAATLILDCSVTSITSEASANTTGFFGYEQASRCRVGAISASAGSAAGFRPSGSSSQTLDCGASSISLNIGIDLENAVGALVRGCRFALGGAGIGIVANGVGNRFEDNTISGCSVGISAGASTTGGLIVRNRVTDCTVPISFNAATWQVGPRISAFGDITTTNPWANFVD